MRRAVVCLLVSLAPLGSACVGIERSFTQASYDFTWQRSCFCSKATRPIRISVADDRIVSAVLIADGQPVPEAIRSELPTINGVYDLIDEAKWDGREVSVTIDADLGYPTLVVFDGSQIPVDGGMTLQLSDVVIPGE